MSRRSRGEGRLEIGPLENLPVIKDLATDMTPFFEKWQDAKGVFAPSQTRHDPIEEIKPESPARRAVDAAIECINCGVCYAACDTVRWNADYLGPAALTRAFTLVNDVRDAGNAERLQAVAAKGGCHSCHSHQSCQELCPQSLNPTAAIAALKRRRPRGLSQRRNRTMNARLYLWQRGSAALMVPLVAIHLAVIFYATRHGMTAADILSRTHGSLPGRRITACSSLAVSIHAAIGIRNILIEWIAAERSPARRCALLFGLVLRRLACALSPLWCCRDLTLHQTSRQRVVDGRTGAPAVRIGACHFSAVAFPGTRTCHRGRSEARRLSALEQSAAGQSSRKAVWSSCSPCICSAGCASW